VGALVLELVLELVVALALLVLALVPAHESHNHIQTMHGYSSQGPLGLHCNCLWLGRILQTPRSGPIDRKEYSRKASGRHCCPRCCLPCCTSHRLEHMSKTYHSKQIGLHNAYHFGPAPGNHLHWTWRWNVRSQYHLRNKCCCGHAPKSIEFGKHHRHRQIHLGKLHWASCTDSRSHHSCIGAYCTQGRTTRCESEPYSLESMVAKDTFAIQTRRSNRQWSMRLWCRR
jgi:hypothetical protein